MENTIDILKIEHVTKRFPGVVALSDVSFTVRQGEVHALIGENGAGKSTLIKAITGVHKVDEGTIKIWHDGEYISPQNVIEAKKVGVYANYQHVNFANGLSVGENYFLGKLPQTKLGLVDWKKIYSESRKLLDEFKLYDVDERMPIGQLSLAMRELVTISAILAIDNVKLVIFDEPTAQLEDSKVEQLFEFVEELKRRKISVIYITHRLEEISRICDRVTILKDGTYVTTENVSDVDNDRLISLMIGREIGEIYDFEHGIPAEVMLKVEHLSQTGKFRDISFSVRAGEILGFFGLVGSGRSEVMKAIFGCEKATAGEIYLKGEKIMPKSPMKAMKTGIGLIPEDRQREGLALGLTVKHNINLNSFDMITKLGVVSRKEETKRAKMYVKQLGIKTPSIMQTASNLSGGNQQKIVISKLLCRDLEVFIFDEPTVGIDVKAKQDIYQLIGELAREGKAVIVISSYLPEVIGISDRIVVFADGRVSGVVGDRELMNEEAILKMASFN